MAGTIRNRATFATGLWKNLARSAPSSSPVIPAAAAADSVARRALTTGSLAGDGWMQTAQRVYKSKLPSWGSFCSSNVENLSRKLACMEVKQNLSSPCCLSFRRFFHFGNVDQGETSRPMDFVRGIMEEGGNGRFGRFQQSQSEQNADILRITMLRNNTFVAITDSKGQKKPGVCASAGTVPDKGGKDSRISAEAACEYVGREAKKAGVKTVVVKVSGFTHFKRKRQAIMAFREGYTFGRGDQTPIIFIEDKTRQAHNGCRKPKKRRI
ncbi:OLC1v1038719C1 [Oldenlandia corymbosa var. corymbosa]|uniref:OLC1v1038719C1 n=1 Tax=Oldenlandia corymbosa var. corymbosa TaxID=529605 RepID=A0AAV1D0F4_OLDCO|nr:OLC1v1038719C1 [Oldenlandia corymbosa var. corymbosa]